MTTPVELINLALKQVGVLGVGQTAAAEDINDAFSMLNMMLSQWSVKRNVVHQILDAPLVATGAATYTVGIGGDFDIARPARVVGAYIRQMNPMPVDTPLKLLQSQTDWGRVSTKTIGSMPSLVYYDPQYPLGVLHVWPIPDNIYEIHLQALVPLQRFETPYDDIELPPEYQEALMYNLAGRLYPMYGMPPDQVVIQLAQASLATVRMANAQIGKLYMPADLVRGANYNVYTDR
jgi:hypothetical protein